MFTLSAFSSNAFGESDADILFIVSGASASTAIGSVTVTADCNLTLGLFAKFNTSVTATVGAVTVTTTSSIDTTVVRERTVYVPQKANANTVIHITEQPRVVAIARRLNQNNVIYIAEQSRIVYVPERDNLYNKTYKVA